MLPLDTHANVNGVRGTGIYKVLTAREAEQSNVEPARCLIWAADPDVSRHSAPYAGQITEGQFETEPSGICVSEIQTPKVVAPGDVIRLVEGRMRLRVLYRRGANSNTLLATEQCNSRCLMCSQPPRPGEDRWLVDDMLTTIPLIDKNETQLGISGGEPTLLGDDLAAVIHQAKVHLPKTRLHILSNGRYFADELYCRAISSVRHSDLCWGIPLYASLAELHDYIVQSQNAWDETLTGLYNLAHNDAEIELRIVVQKANLDYLGELAYFIFRNLSFVRHVAFMGLEPIGFARINKKNIFVDPALCGDALREAVHFLVNRGIDTSIYNIPLCALPHDLWPYAAQSISDWKNKYLPECQTCGVKDRCGGFFQWVDRSWLPSTFGPVTGLEISAKDKAGEMLNEKAMA